MRKNNDPTDQSYLIWRETFDASSPRRLGGTEFKIEEFGISAREALSPDILLKKIAYACDGPTTINVFLCYNWKCQSPFVLVSREVEHKTCSYTPQYGHEDNYPESKWKEITYQFYSPAELSSRQPEIEAILRSL
jgi:hypothetical protein